MPTCQVILAQHLPTNKVLSAIPRISTGLVLFSPFIDGKCKSRRLGNLSTHFKCFVERRGTQLSKIIHVQRNTCHHLTTRCCDRTVTINPFYRCENMANDPVFICPVMSNTFQNEGGDACVRC